MPMDCHVSAHTGATRKLGTFPPIFDQPLRKKLISTKKLPTMADLLRQAQFWK